VIGTPPSDEGAVNSTESARSPNCVTDVIVGAEGAAPARALTVAIAPFPREFVAYSSNEYSTLFVSPVTTRGELEPVAVAPPGVAVAVYPVIVNPPSFAGGKKLMVT
jgi:hypothetical protein